VATVAISTPNGVAEPVGNSFEMVFGSVTFGDEYADDGVAITLASLGLVELQHLQVSGGQNASNTGLMASWNGSTTAPTIQLWDCGADGDPLDELAAGADTANGMVVHFIAFGRG
jgi:hypothetical protein